jgi:hypothetical protein
VPSPASRTWAAEPRSLLYWASAQPVSVPRLLRLSASGRNKIHPSIHRLSQRAEDHTNRSARSAGCAGCIMAHGSDGTLQILQLNVHNAERGAAKSAKQRMAQGLLLRGLPLAPAFQSALHTAAHRLLGFHPLPFLTTNINIEGECNHRSALDACIPRNNYTVSAISELYARTMDGSVVAVPMGHHIWTKLTPTTKREALWTNWSMLWCGATWSSSNSGTISRSHRSADSTFRPGNAGSVSLH